jgi:phage terminase small subunit
MAIPASNISRVRPPPKYLGAEGAAFWRSTVRDYEIVSESLLAHLEVVAGALDRLAECRRTIKAEGLTIVDRRGDRVPHPLLKAEAAARAAFQSGMRALRLQSGPGEKSR